MHCIYVYAGMKVIVNYNLCYRYPRAVYVSYGGLLMKLQGDANNFQGFTMDMNLYLLLKKLAF